MHNNNVGSIKTIKIIFKMTNFFLIIGEYNTKKKLRRDQSRKRNTKQVTFKEVINKWRTHIKETIVFLKFNIILC